MQLRITRLSRSIITLWIDVGKYFLVKKRIILLTVSTPSVGFMFLYIYTVLQVKIRVDGGFFPNYLSRMMTCCEFLDKLVLVL